MWERILKKVQVTTNMLQTKNLDLSACAASLKSLCTYLELRVLGEWDAVRAEAEALAESSLADAYFKLDIAHNLYRYAANRIDTGIAAADREDRFRRGIFEPVVRTCIQQAKLRFQGANETVQLFRCLLPEFLKKSDTGTLRQAAAELQVKYRRDLQENFAEELVSLYDDHGDRIHEMKSPKEILEMLVKDGATGEYPTVVAALLVFCTLPVTVASAERSFSKLKILKTYLRSTIGQQRLSHLAFLSIENAHCKSVDISLIIKLFANGKAGKGPTSRSYRFSQ